MVVIVINCVKIDNYHYFASSALFQIDAFKEVRSPGRTLIEAKIHIGTQASHPHPRKQRAVGCAPCGVPTNNVQWGALCGRFRTKRRMPYKRFINKKRLPNSVRQPLNQREADIRLNSFSSQKLLWF